METPERAVLTLLTPCEDANSGYDEGEDFAVQFNPETLTVDNGTVVSTTRRAAGGRGRRARSLPASRHRQLQLELLFDATGANPQHGEGSLREHIDELRRKVLEPAKQSERPADSADSQEERVPHVKFEYQDFSFTGLVQSLNEQWEFFSSDGKPLRIRLSFTLIDSRPSGNGQACNKDDEASAAPGGQPGTRPLAQARAGGDMAEVARRAGAGDDWQSMAAANGIDNPRRLRGGQLVDTGRRVLGGRS